MLGRVSVHTELFLRVGYWGFYAAQAGDGQGHAAALGLALQPGHGLASVTPFSWNVLALGEHAVQEWLGRAWVSEVREQSLVSEHRLARISDAPRKCYSLATSFTSWGKISSLVRPSMSVCGRGKIVQQCYL